MTDEMNYKEEYEKVHEELETLKARYFKAREEAIRRQDYAAVLSSNKLIRAYRKASTAAGREDPFKRLRPEVTQAEAGILFNIDSALIKMKSWSSGAGPTISADFCRISLSGTRAGSFHLTSSATRERTSTTFWA